jgi:DNA-binding transcriptional LysR family regulator
MRLRHIEVFHAVMQAGSVSGAAQLLHISQPAVTKALQHCELRLGMPLFERLRGKLHATPEARRLYVEVEKVNADLVAIRRLAANLRAGDSELLRIVCIPTLSVSILPQAIMQWSQANPEAHCVLATNHTREIVSALLLGEADLALSIQDPRHPGIRAEVLATGPLVALCPLGSTEGKGRGPLALADIRTELIALAEADPLGALVASALDAEGVRPTSRITVQTYQLACSLVEAGAGMTVVDPFTAVSADTARVKVRPVAPAVQVHLYLLSPANAPLTQSARRILKLLSSQVQQRLAAMGL